MSALTDVFANMDISIPADKMQQLAQKVMTGYKDYIIGNGILGLDRLAGGRLVSGHGARLRHRQRCGPARGHVEQPPRP